MRSASPVSVVGEVAVIGMFGAIGGLAAGLYDAHVQGQREAAFDAVMKKNNFAPADVLNKTLTQQLQAEGYVVTTESVTRPTADFLPSYPAAPGPLLDVVLANEGYLTQGSPAAYQPVVDLKYKLVGTGGTVLAEGAFQYSNFKGDQQPDPAYNYPDYGSLSVNPALAIKGQTSVLTQATASVALALK